jgi:outer membrane cobalamin receptor
MSPAQILATAAALAAALPAPVLAQDVADLAGLLNEPVISTASKSAETAGLAPATTSVITAEDLRRHGFVSLAEAINFVGLGMITEPSYATPEIGARGVLLSGDYGNHVLLLLDGHALNEPWDGTAYSDRSAAIPMDLVDHIEVILGPGSVLYGSSAMLGVINVVTKRAKDYAGVHLAADGSFPAAGHAFAGYGREFELAGRPGEVVLGADYYRAVGPPVTYGAQPWGDATWGGTRATHRLIEIPGAHLRVAYGEVELTVRAAQSRRAATEAYVGTSYDDPANYERDRWLSADARWSSSFARVKTTVRLYGDVYDYLDHAPSLSPALDCLADQSTGCVYRNGGSSRWGGGEASAAWDWLGDGRLVTLLGADVRGQRVGSFVAYDDAATGITQETSRYTKTASVVGAYLQQTARPASWLHLNAGVRVDDDDQVGSHVSPRVAVVSPAWRGGTLKAIYAEAYRAPTFYERYYADSTYQIAAPELRPETVRSVEGVVEQRIGAHRFRLGGFRTWWSDLVVQVPATDAQVAAAVASGALVPGATGVVTYANASRVDSYGLNADWEGSGAGQRLRFGATLTVAHSRREEQGTQLKLPAAAQVFGNARVSYDLGGRLPVLAVAARAAGPRPISGTTFTPVPEAKTQVEVKGAVSGPLSGALSYQLAGTWALTGATAYAVGPVREPQPGFDRQPTLAQPRFTAMLGLRLDR